MKKEKGMALIVAIFVTIFLLLMSVAFFTSSRKEAKFSRQSMTGVVSMAACEGGAERALWYIQQAMDANPNWAPGTSTGTVLVEPETVLLNGFGDYRNFVKNMADKTYEYINYGVTIEETNSENKERQSHQMYALKMIKQDDPTTTAVEWMLYSAGASRLATSDASTAKQMKDIQILVRLGRTILGNSEQPTIFDGHKQGGNSQNVNVSPATHIEAMLNGVSAPADIYTENNWISNNATQGKRDGFYPGSNIELKLAPGISVEGMNNDVSWNSLKNKTITPNVKMDFLNIDFDKFNGKKSDGAKPDYTAQQLVNDGLWEIKNGYYTPKHDLMYIAGRNTSVKTSPSPSNPYNYVYNDIDDDGYTIIYIPPGMGFRFGTSAKTQVISVENGAHGILLSEGVSISTGNSVYGNSNDAISNVGIDIRAQINSANGINKAGGIKLTGGLLPCSYETLADFRLGVDFPYPETVGNYNAFGMYGASSDSLTVSIWQDKNGNFLDNKTGKIINHVSGSNEPLWSDTVGVLDILSSNNVIVSNTNIDNYPQGSSLFRGYIYSKQEVIIQADLVIRGALSGQFGVSWVNQLNNGRNNGLYGGYERVLLKEDPTARGGNANLSLVVGAGGTKTDHRQLQILAWNIKK
ncbi:MAG: hypothetical protein V1749_06685 [Candidatus Desantisbacteria bacterium]